MYKPQIKASHITNLTDARYFAAWGVEWLGFTLESGQDHFIPPTQVAAIKEWIEGPKMVGEFSGLDTELIEETVELLKLYGVEVAQFAELEKINVSVPIIINLVITTEMTEEELRNFIKEKSIAHHYILDFSKNNIALDIFSTTLLKELLEQQSIFIRPGKNIQSIKSILYNIQPTGLSVAGGEEEKVGLKSFDELDEIYDILEPLRQD